MNPEPSRYNALPETNTGKVRTNNEDTPAVAVIEHPNGRYHLWIVADGMGGGSRGEVASAKAVEVVVDYFRTSSWFNPTETLEAAVREANRVVYDLGTGHGEATRSLMGTTLVAALVHDRTGQCWIANVGDSRAYLYRDGRLDQITDDHSLVAERERAGLITAEEARRSESRNVITRAIGPDAEVEPDILELPSPLGPTDLLLLCSDGLHGMIDDAAIARIVARTSPASIPHQLIAAANRAGGRDNVTVVVGGQSVPANADGSLPETLVEIGTRSRATRRKLSLLVLLGGIVVLAATATVVAALLRGRDKEDGDLPAFGTSEPPTVESSLSPTATRTPKLSVTPPPTTVPPAAAPPTSVEIGPSRQLVKVTNSDGCNALVSNLTVLDVQSQQNFLDALGKLNGLNLVADSCLRSLIKPLIFVPSNADLKPAASVKAITCLVLSAADPRTPPAMPSGTLFADNDQKGAIFFNPGILSVPAYELSVDMRASDQSITSYKAASPQTGPLCFWRPNEASGTLAIYISDPQSASVIKSGALTLP